MRNPNACLETLLNFDILVGVPPTLQSAFSQHPERYRDGYLDELASQLQSKYEVLASNGGRGKNINPGEIREQIRFVLESIGFCDKEVAPKGYRGRSHGKKTKLHSEMWDRRKS